MKAFKQYDLAAHDSNVNCLSIGPQSGRVLVTGGADRRINLWKIGQMEPLLSLGGHATPIDSVCLDWPEELMVAGATSGAIKLWDLESNRVVRTLSGHSKSTCCVEFHPFGDFFASGSLDLTVKIWDIRRKGCIQTYHGHQDKVEIVKITPDGRWLATGSLDTSINIWDMTAGKLLHTITQHTAPITCLTFHPSEFLMAASSQDGIVHVYDLQNFECISKLPRLEHFAQITRFSSNGNELYCASKNAIHKCQWEHFKGYETTRIEWPNIKDLKFIGENQLVGATVDQNLVGIWNIDVSPPPPIQSTSASLNPKTTNVQDLSNSFSGAFDRLQVQEDSICVLAHSSMSIIQSPLPEPKLQSIPHSIPPPQQVPVQYIPEQVQIQPQKPEPTQAQTKRQKPLKRNIYIPVSDGNTPLNLDISKFIQGSNSLDISASLPISPVEAGMNHFNDEDLMEMLKFRHTSLINIFQSRLYGIRCIHDAWDEENMKAAVEAMSRSRDSAVWVDILRILNLRPRLLTLDVAILLLPMLRDLLFEIFEDYLLVACDTIRILARSFSDIIMTSLSMTEFTGVDISREERIQKCKLGHSRFVEIYTCLKEMTRTSGKLGTCIIDTINELLIFT